MIATIATQLEQRSLSIDLFAPDEQRQAILNSIRRYRACCRDVYATLLLSQAAGAAIEEVDEQLRVTPNGERAKLILAAAMDKGGKALAYECRDLVLKHLWPTAFSFVWDSIRRDVVTVWTSKDPEFNRASRGWLALQGARNVAQFNWRGIGCPLATAKPVLIGHALILKWDHDIGLVTFSLPRLDGGRYHVWRALRDGTDDMKLGTLFLNERDGRIFATISYSRPANLQNVEVDRVCKVTFGDEPASFIRLVGPDGEQTTDSISGMEADAWLRQLSVRKAALELRRAACGNPKRPWGHKKAWNGVQDVLSRCTLNRARGVSERNHAWTRRIVSRAVAWRCGTLEIAEYPDDMFAKSWPWTEFGTFLAYKAKEVGITVHRFSG